MYSFCIRPAQYILPALLSPCLLIITCLDAGLISHHVSKEMMLFFYLILCTFPALLFGHYMQVIYTMLFTIFISVLCIYIFYQKSQFLYFIEERGLTFHILIFSMLMFVSHSITYFTKKKLIALLQNGIHIQNFK